MVISIQEQQSAHLLFGDMVIDEIQDDLPPDSGHALRKVVIYWDLSLHIKFLSLQHMQLPFFPA